MKKTETGIINDRGKRGIETLRIGYGILFQSAFTTESTIRFETSIRTRQLDHLTAAAFDADASHSVAFALQRHDGFAGVASRPVNVWGIRRLKRSKGGCGLALGHDLQVDRSGG